MHTIRLRAPWQRTRSGESASTRVDVPDEQINEDNPSGSVHYARNFNFPTGLTDNSRVILAVDGWSGTLKEVSLNGQEIQTGVAPLIADITNQLLPHNQLEIHVVCDQPDPARLSGPVTLRILDEPES